MCDTAPVTPWTVMTWNLHGADGVDIEAVAAAIEPERVDILVVQEIRRGDAGRLARRLSMNVDWALKHYPYTWLVWWRAEGMAILSAHEIAEPGAMQISVDAGRRWDWHRRIAQWAHVRRDVDPAAPGPEPDSVLIVNLHLSPHADAPARLAEAHRVAALTTDLTQQLDSVSDSSRLATQIGHRTEVGGDGAARRTVPVVVAGDFNDGDDAAIIDALPGIEQIRPSNTNPAATPSQVLDHVLTPAEATDVSVTVPAGGPAWAALSDHLPVTVRFRLR